MNYFKITFLLFLLENLHCKPDVKKKSQKVVVKSVKQLEEESELFDPNNSGINNQKQEFRENHQDNNFNNNNQKNKIMLNIIL